MNPIVEDDIISIRKIDPIVTDEADIPSLEKEAESPQVDVSPSTSIPEAPSAVETNPIDVAEQPSVHLFLLAKEDKRFAGYELLQTLLAAGLRYGEGHLFHRHQHQNGQGPIICSLATATEDGTFDLQNMGGMSVHGLCMFMDGSGNPSIDQERLSLMVETAKQLAENLDAHLLDDQRQPWQDDTSMLRYQRILNAKESAEMMV